MVQLPFSVPYLHMKIRRQNGLALSTQGSPNWGEGIRHPEVSPASKQIGE